MFTSFSDDTFAVVAADAAVDKLGGIDVDIFGFGLRQCLSYRIPNKTIKYSINAKNTNNVHDISHTWNKSFLYETPQSLK